LDYIDHMLVETLKKIRR